MSKITIEGRRMILEGEDSLNIIDLDKIDKSDDMFANTRATICYNGNRMHRIYLSQGDSGIIYDTTDKEKTIEIIKFFLKEVTNE